MFTKIRNWFFGLFIDEVRVIRPGSESVDISMNRKQRRAKASIERKQARRRKKRASVPKPKRD